ncbi:MAG TPA: hypothetical protein VD866_29605 [Urbifossiella sp.]|nr:hypothetical protein [Urbifossiella sp.]
MRDDDYDDDRARDYDERDRDYDEPAYPLTVTLAGVAWIGFGGLLIANMLLVLVLMGGMMAAGRGGPQAGGPAGGAQADRAAAAGPCGAVLSGLFGAAFLLVGVQSVRGTARDTLGNGIGSIVFGLIQYAAGALSLVAGQGQVELVIAAVLHFLVGTGLVGAGAMALAGRGAYKAWRRANKPQYRGRRR